MMRVDIISFLFAMCAVWLVFGWRSAGVFVVALNFRRVLSWLPAGAALRIGLIPPVDGRGVAGRHLTACCAASASDVGLSSPPSPFRLCFVPGTNAAFLLHDWLH